MNQKDSGQEIEIIFADGMSDDGTREIIEGHIRNNGNIQLIDNPEKIVKVTKEVPVEKIVKETVEVEKVVYKEVPKEVVRKEVIHVPIYTNDTDLLKFGTTKVEDILDDD